MNEQQNIEVVKRGYEAFGSGDINSLLDLFHENIEWHQPQAEGLPYQERYDGREAVGGMFAALDENEDISHFEPHEFIAQGDKVVVLGTMSATVKDTGRDYQTDWVHIFTVRDGKVTNFKELFDTAAASKAFQKAATA
jgi:uncharacterized protein